MLRPLWVLLLVSCNQLYGLDETSVRPPGPPPDAPPPDVDEDGVNDDVDNCPGVADATQADGDGDGFGDVCDHCPIDSTAFNHDEDTDTHGDECDFCPADPDFQLDGDDDRVGDACDNDNATKNKLRLFDPFLQLAPVWEKTGTWSALGDAVVPEEAGATLQAATIRVDGSVGLRFELRVGVSLPAVLTAGDRFSLRLIDDAGVVVAGCTVTCTATQQCVIVGEPSLLQVPVTPPPFANLILRRSLGRDYCVFGEFEVSDEINEAPVFPSAHVELVGSPNVQFRYAVVWQ